MFIKNAHNYKIIIQAQNKCVLFYCLIKCLKFYATGVEFIDENNTLRKKKYLKIVIYSENDVYDCSHLMGFRGVPGNSRDRKEISIVVWDFDRTQIVGRLTG